MVITVCASYRLCPSFANSVAPDQLASEEANWSGSALFFIHYVHLSAYYTVESRYIKH